MNPGGNSDDVGKNLLHDIHPENVLQPCSQTKACRLDSFCAETRCAQSFVHSAPLSIRKGKQNRQVGTACRFYLYSP
jgi:hypothetical protein